MKPPIWLAAKVTPPVLATSMRWVADSLVHMISAPASAQMCSAAMGVGHRQRHLGVPDPVETTRSRSRSRVWSSVKTLPSSSTRVRFSPPGSITAPRWAPEARTRSATCPAAARGSLAMTAAVAA